MKFEVDAAALAASKATCGITATAARASSRAIRGVPSQDPYATMGRCRYTVPGEMSPQWCISSDALAASDSEQPARSPASADSSPIFRHASSRCRPRKEGHEDSFPALLGSDGADSDSPPTDIMLSRIPASTRIAFSKHRRRAVSTQLPIGQQAPCARRRHRPVDAHPEINSAFVRRQLPIEVTTTSYQSPAHVRRRQLEPICPVRHRAHEVSTLEVRARRKGV
ncbi:hypothetical protein C8Q77DRAFT_312523 [Trametes polyzona]|nr:hypothetical protein C8Q77DRAFT_312523 [Trametes polyzona]